MPSPVRRIGEALGTALFLILSSPIILLGLTIVGVDALGQFVGRTIRQEPSPRVPERPVVDFWSEDAEAEDAGTASGSATAVDRLRERFLQVLDEQTPGIALTIDRTNDAWTVTSEALAPDRILLESDGDGAIDVTIGPWELNGWELMDGGGGREAVELAVCAVRNGIVYRRLRTTVPFVRQEESQLWWRPIGDSWFHATWYRELPGREATPEEITRHLRRR